jgi:glycosyltransferase involved in cell wall biosynthesis
MIIHYPCISVSSNPYNQLLISSLNQIEFRSNSCNSILSLYRLVLSGQVSAIHFHWLDRAGGQFSRVPSKLLWQLFIILILIIARLLNIKLVWTVHNLNAHNSSVESHQFYHLVAILVDSLIAHSPSAIDIISATYNVRSNKIHFIPHGLYPQACDINPIPLTSISHSSPRLRLLYFGNISPYKGIDLFASALQKVAKPLGDLNPLVWIIGNINASRYPELGLQLTQCDNVTIISEFVDESQLLKFVSDADLIVLPFRDTLTSGSLVYALSSAKPVLISDIPSLSFYLSPDYSFKFNPGCVDSLASQLTYICLNHTHNSLHYMGQLARTFAMTLDWRSIAIATSQLYS